MPGYFSAGVIPDETKALSLLAPANAVAGLLPGGGLLPTPNPLSQVGFLVGRMKGTHCWPLACFLPVVGWFPVKATGVPMPRHGVFELGLLYGGRCCSAPIRFLSACWWAVRSASLPCVPCTSLTAHLHLSSLFSPLFAYWQTWEEQRVELKFLNFKRALCCGEITSSNIQLREEKVTACVCSLNTQKSRGRWTVKNIHILQNKKSNTSH